MNYYNEHDKKAAAWLRVLISENLIAPGEVDERDVQDVRATDLAGFRQCHFFAGIGGWSLALRLAGWPDERPVWTGSCPCQPFSAAGQGMGIDDERHLWPDFRNLVGQCLPTVVFGEQVASKLGREWLAGVRADLENAGYAFGATDLCAAGVASPQRRQRFFWVASAVVRGCAPGSDAKPGQESRGAFADEPSTTDAVANSKCGATERQRQHMADATAGIEREAWQRERIWDDIGASGFTFGLAHPGHVTGSAECELQLHGASRVEQSSSAVAGLVQPNGSGRNAGRTSAAPAGHGSSAEPAGGVGFWSDSRIIHTTGGKARRIPVEPAFFPLVDGFPARVALLKGFGNAIVPQVAAQFIRAYLETLT